VLQPWLVRAVAMWTVPTGFIGVPPPGPRPGDRHGDMGVGVFQGALGHHPRHRLGDRAQVGDQVAGTPSISCLARLE
jgi:hypothetical protein